MGRIIKHEIVGFTCELRTCKQTVRTGLGYPAKGTWHDHLQELERLVGLGWSLVLNPQLRTYCPEHADRCWDCTCRKHPHRAALCTAHSRDAAGHVWDAVSTPEMVTEFRKVLS